MPTSKTTIPGVEVRGVGAYIIAAPSVHPSGVLYWGPLPPIDELAPVPDWVPGLLEKASGTNGSAPPVAEHITAGARNAELTSFAGTMRRRGADESTILAALRDMNATKCMPPLPDDEVARIAASVARYPPKDAPKPKRDPDELSDLKVPPWLAEELAEAGVSDNEIESAGSLKDLMGLLGGGKQNVATKLVKLVLDADVELFHDPADRAFATFAIGDHRETHALASQPFRRYVRRLFYLAEESAANGQSVTDALGVLEGKACFEGDEHDVNVRVAGDATRILIDLGDDGWQAIEVTRGGWRILDHHPVKFRRTGGMAALPMPAAGGSVEALRPFVNVDPECDDWKLVVGWLLAALRPGFPFPVLIAHGEQGSSKSTLNKVLRQLVDPNASPLRAAPHDVDDLMVSASASWVVAYDNISRITPALSDALCRLSTGGGLSKRALYTDSDEVLLEAMRPVLLNGIDEVAHRGDLLDRALLIEMPIIAEDKRRGEEAFWADFTAVRAGILGGLCDALACALGRIADVHLDRLPRMADFAAWVTAAEPALGWTDGAFTDAYAGNRADAVEVALDASPICPLLLNVAAAGFEGTATELLASLGAELVGRLGENGAEKAQRAKDWPRNARALRAELDRIAPNLRALGYDVTHNRDGHDRRRTVTLSAPTDGDA